MAVPLSLLVKNPFRNARVVALTAVLLVGAAILLLREPRVSFLRPGLRLNAYVSTEDGSVAVVDLVRLRAVARVNVGPGLSGMREHPTRAEVWGVSSQGGYVWVLNARVNQVVARACTRRLRGATQWWRLIARPMPLWRADGLATNRWWRARLPTGRACWW